MRARLIAVILAVLVSLSVPGRPVPAQELSLVQAAKKEGRVVWYAGVALGVAEHMAQVFEKAYGVHVELFRSGTERIITRVLQEDQAGIHNVDVLEVSDAGDFPVLKGKGILAQYWPSGHDRLLRAFLIDPDGYFHAWRATLGLPVYNTKLVPPSSVPKSWKDLTDPRWKGKLLKVHFGSGAATNVMAAITRLYGWDYYRQIKRNDPMIVQAASEGVSSIAAGERAIIIEGNHYNAARLKARGNPVDMVFPVEGVVLVLSPMAIAQKAPHPNAARLFAEYMFNRQIQQMVVDDTRLYVAHPDVRYPPDMPALSSLKLLAVPVGELVKRNEEIRRMFTEIFGI